MKRNEIVLVALMALLNFTHILDFMIMMPLGNILMPQWNLNSSQFSIIVSSYSLAAFVSSFAAIFFADKFDRKNVLLVAYFGFLAGTLGCAFATNGATMILARSITGIFGGLISAQVLSIIADIIPYERRGQAMGMLMGGFALASVVGVPFGLYLANQFNWYFPFLVVAGVGVLLFPLLLRYVPSVGGHMANPIPLKGRIESFVHIFSDRTQMTALAFSFILIMGHFLIIPLFNPYMVYNVGVPQKDTPLIYLFGGISSLITAQFVGKLSDKYGKRQVFVIAAAASLILILMLTNMPRIPVYWVLIIFSVWFSAATGRTVPGQAMTTQAVSAKTRGSFMSLNSCMQSLGTGFAGLISGWLTFSDSTFAIHHYDYLGYLSAILILICIALAIRLDKLLVVNGLK
ncbi:MAG: MFS transporter [Cyclobacteriaceae bacterium]|nr:MFS transporter [Cyclobacteriaceae bacterium]